jgi:hypothetical protein
MNITNLNVTMYKFTLEMDTKKIKEFKQQKDENIIFFWIEQFK